MQHRQIVGLDPLRFLAAMLVALFHLGPLAGSAYAPFGWIGVQLFFMLSGFLIAYTGHDVSAALFLKRRIVRLMPGVWICATLSLAALWLADADMAGMAQRYLATLILWPGGRWIETLYWTLIVEISFYGVILLAIRFGSGRRMAYYMIALGAVNLASWVVRFAALAAGYSLDRYVGHILLLPFASFFAVGGLLWACLLDRSSTPRRIALGLCVVACLVQIGYGASSPRAFVPPAILLLGTIAAIVLAVRRPLAPRFGPLMRRIGLLTYPLYLLHLSIGTLVLKWLPALPRPLPLIVALAVAIFVAAVIALAIEPVAQRRLKRLLERLPLFAPGAAQAAASRSTR